MPRLGTITVCEYEASMNRVTINGQTFESEGPITVINGRVTVGGKQLAELKETIIRIEVEGDLSSLKTDASVTVKGNVQGDVDAGGSVTAGDVGGDVDAGGSVNCGDVKGDVDAGGSINCRTVSGGVRS